MPPQKPKSPPRKDTRLRRIAQEVPKDELVSALSNYSDDDKVEKLLQMMENPAYAHHTFGSLARKVGLSGQQVALMFRGAKRIEGIIRQSRHLPDIMEDTAIDALSIMKECPKCSGDGRIKDKQCTRCDGEGKIREPGNSDARKLVYEVAGLAGKRGPLVAQNFNFQGSPSPEELIGSVDEVIDAEIISSEDSEEEVSDD